MIEISLSQDSQGTDHASALWNGLNYAYRSRHGATMALARVLVAAGCPDQPWRVPGRFSGRSLHSWAKLTVKEGPPPRIVLWQPYQP